MEIEAKPKLDRNYVSVMLQWLVSAHDHKMEPIRFDQFLKDAEVAFLRDMQLVAEAAFNKGREYERCQINSGE
ncbi:hypothetical protein EDC30_109136 [Paucimonas lemoignei]|uniref:Uncharacterized protein n=1 Tax=Paucimonas lemoignei TaxID=29443 RepID=A0A4R3HRT2_PAULE|nr:hypothetical protein [Paucimonas lemoignei]TCS35837.1 hypothetical protein EDC30_109136 [Paucimonas lemoignei]